MASDIFVIDSNEIFENISQLDIDYKKINNSEYKFELNNFIRIMKKNFPDIDQRLLAKNINFLNIEYTPHKRDSYYYPLTNTITLSKRQDIYHELFHMASAMVDDEYDLIYQGISQCDLISRKKQIGTTITFGINEGYTELLTERYFNINTRENYIYDIEKFYASKIEEIIGFKKMAEIYFKANLNELMRELLNYQSEENVVYMLECIDYISAHSFDLKHKIITPTKKKMIKYYHDVNKILINTYYNKLLSEYYINHDSKSLTRKLKRFINSFYNPSSDFTLYYGNYTFDESEDYYRYINENRQLIRQKKAQ